MMVTPQDPVTGRSKQQPIARGAPHARADDLSVEVNDDLFGDLVQVRRIPACDRFGALDLPLPRLPFLNKAVVNHALPMLVDGEPVMPGIADRFNGLSATPNCGQF